LYVKTHTHEDYLMKGKRGRKD